MERVEAHQLLKKGGKWLAAARSFLQWHIRGGDRVTWGSGDQVTMSVDQIQRMAAEIAAAAINERAN